MLIKLHIWGDQFQHGVGVGYPICHRACLDLRTLYSVLFVEDLS